MNGLNSKNAAPLRWEVIQKTLDKQRERFHDLRPICYVLVSVDRLPMASPCSDLADALAKYVLLFSQMEKQCFV
jgi:hypothetical protein